MSDYKTTDKTEWFIRKLKSGSLSRRGIIELAAAEFPAISWKTLDGTIGQYWSDSVNPKCSTSKAIRERGLKVIEADARRRIVQDSGAPEIPAGKDETSSRLAPASERSSSVRQKVASMSDPLGGFPWQNLYDRYDTLCSRFNQRSAHVIGLRAAAASDRELYCILVQRAMADRSGKRPAVDLAWYEAMLYWKLYSGRYFRNIPEWLPGDQVSQHRNAKQLQDLLVKMPRTIPRQFPAIVSLLELIGEHRLGGMRSETAIPVRTTFLHFLYPNVVPIFDKMVLQAVGVTNEGANQRQDVFRKYLQHVWGLARKHAGRLRGFRETPVRLTDMALWIIRNRVKAQHC